MQNQTPSKDGQASAEIEITPEMIEAGVAALGGFYTDEVENDSGRVVAKVWAAMFVARPL